MTPETRAALALADAGVPVGAIDRVLGLLDVDTHDNEATITAKVDELRSDLPGVWRAGVRRAWPCRVEGRRHQGEGRRNQRGGTWPSTLRRWRRPATGGLDHGWRLAHDQCRVAG
jgi:hypothetical protein